MADDKTKRMRRVYASLQTAEMAFARDYDHPFRGDGPKCEWCGCPKTDPLHDVPPKPPAVP